MTYGLSPTLFIENGPSVTAARASRARSTAARSWRGIAGERRLQLVDGALKAAANDDPFDTLPLAL